LETVVKNWVKKNLGFKRVGKIGWLKIIRKKKGGLTEERFWTRL